MKKTHQQPRATSQASRPPSGNSEDALGRVIVGWGLLLFFFGFARSVLLLLLLVSSCGVGADLPR